MAKVSLSYYLMDKLHREDGPAYWDSDGNSSWYLMGTLLNKEQIKTLGVIRSCPVEKLPLYMGDPIFDPIIEKRFRMVHKRKKRVKTGKDF